jgi:asparagine synthase (glutamine-hydrolysing)
MSQGIFGVVDFNRSISDPESVARRMSFYLRRDTGTQASVSVLSETHYVLGMKRIPAKAETQGQEIFSSPSLYAVALIRGEINNFTSLAAEAPHEFDGCRGDLDLVLRLYRRDGPNFARKLNGLFSLAVLDERERCLILLNDRFGMAHQVYWTLKGERFYFSTHLKTLLACPEIQKEIDPEGLNLFLKYSYVPSPWSIFKDVRKLQPGHLLLYQDGKVMEREYWGFDLTRPRVKDLEQAIAVYRDLFRKSVSRRLDADGDVGILLSGGLDSSANVAIATECSSGKQLKTFSIGFGDPKFDERPYARIVARHFNTRHFERTITGGEIEDLPKLVLHLEEPYFEFGLFLTYLGLAGVREEADVVIGGEGADQLFGTGGFAGALPVALRYLLLRCHLLGPAGALARRLKGDYFCDRDNLAFKLRMLWNRVVDLNNWYFYGYEEDELELIHRNPDLASMPRIFDTGRSPAPGSFSDLYHETQVAQDLRHYVNENVMVKSGRMADMLNLTLRETYLDAEVADFLVSLDFPLKRSGDLFDHLRGRFKTKYLHRKAMERLLPAEILTKPKQGGFVPVMIFLKDETLRQRIYSRLLQSEAVREYFRPDLLREMFGRYERLQGQEIYWHNFYNAKANRILFLLTFDIWHHFYVKNDPLEAEPVSLSDYLGS